MAIRGKKKMRAPAYGSDDSNVVNWAMECGIISHTVGNLMKGNNSWSVRVNPNAKKPTSYFSKICNGIFAQKGRNESIPGYVEAFAARIGSPLVLSDSTKVSNAQKQAVAHQLGMDKPADILNVSTEGEKAIKPSSNIHILRQALNDGPSASVDQTSDGQLDGAKQRVAIEEINHQVEKSTTDIHEPAHDTHKEKAKRPIRHHEEKKTHEEPEVPPDTPGDQTTPDQTKPDTPDEQPETPPEGKKPCPFGTVPVTETEASPVIPGIAEKPAADPNSTAVQPGTLGYQQAEGPRRRLTTVENIADDVRNTSNDTPPPTENKRTGDTPTDVQNHEPYETDLRPEYAMAEAGSVIPSTRKQLESDIRFDMFDQVKPGFGEGMDNKLFLMQEARDKQIVYAHGMHEPGQWIGPTAGVEVPPWQWQRVIPGERLYNYQQEHQYRQRVGDQLLLNNGPRSSNILGDDIGYPMPHSASELKRNKYSPFEPVIRTDMHWQQVKEPIGVKLNRKRMRLETDAQRYPRNFDSFVNEQRGAHLPKRRALEVVLP